jgi:hypothetical protein
VKEVMDTSIKAEKAKNWEDEVEGTQGDVPNGDSRLDNKKKRKKERKKESVRQCVT